MKLDQFLKFQGLVGTGGEAKQRIQAGDIKVNGVVETRRGRHLAPGDAVELDGRELLVLPQRRAGDPQPGER
jgi:ribosome-associated protein